MPLYLGEGFSTSASIGKAVVAIQNYQIKVPTNIYCGNAAMFVNGRTSVASLLLSIGSTLSGLTDSHSDSRYNSASAAHLCGQSPVFGGIGVKVPTFSQLDLVKLISL